MASNTTEVSSKRMSSARDLSQQTSSSSSHSNTVTGRSHTFPMSVSDWLTGQGRYEERAEGDGDEDYDDRGWVAEDDYDGGEDEDEYADGDEDLPSGYTVEDDALDHSERNGHYVPSRFDIQEHRGYQDEMIRSLEEQRDRNFEQEQFRFNGARTDSDDEDDHEESEEYDGVYVEPRAYDKFDDGHQHEHDERSTFGDDDQYYAEDEGVNDYDFDENDTEADWDDDPDVDMSGRIIPPVGSPVANGWNMDAPMREALKRGTLLFKPPFLSTVKRPYQMPTRERTDAWSRVKDFIPQRSRLHIMVSSAFREDYPDSLDALEYDDPAHKPEWWEDAVPVGPIAMAEQQNERKVDNGVGELIPDLIDLSVGLNPEPASKTIHPSPGLWFDVKESLTSFPALIPTHASEQDYSAPLGSDILWHIEDASQASTEVQGRYDLDEPSLLDDDNWTPPSLAGTTFTLAETEPMQSVAATTNEPQQARKAPPGLESTCRESNAGRFFDPSGDNILWARCMLSNFRLRNSHAPLRSKLPLVYATPSGWKLSNGYAFWKYLDLHDFPKQPIHNVTDFVPIEKLFVASMAGECDSSESTTAEIDLFELLKMCQTFARNGSFQGSNWIALPPLDKERARNLMRVILPLVKPVDRLFFGFHDLQDARTIAVLFWFEVVQEELYLRLLKEHGLS